MRVGSSIIYDNLIGIAGMFVAVFAIVLFFMYYIPSIGQTKCWSDTVQPFNEKLQFGSMMMSSLGSLESFSIRVNKDKDEKCLDHIYFISRDRPWECSRACLKSELDKETIEWCEGECGKKCLKDESDCIVLIPKETGWKDVLGWFRTRNKPIIYGGGKYNLVFPTELAGIDKGITIESKSECIVFNRNDKETYQVSVSDKASDCNA